MEVTYKDGYDVAHVPPLWVDYGVDGDNYIVTAPSGRIYTVEGKTYNNRYSYLVYRVFHAPSSEAVKDVLLCKNNSRFYSAVKKKSLVTPIGMYVLYDTMQDAMNVIYYTEHLFSKKHKEHT